MKKTKNELVKYDNVNKAVYGLVGQDSVILDIGCWNGALGNMLITEKNCQVDGIDSNTNALKVAKKTGYDEIFLADLNNLNDLPIPNRKYDYIIYADVLEHILYPEKIINFYKKYLKKNGRIIVSLPNIAFIYYRLKLLSGNFDYKNVGVLDETHVKFYTLKSMRNLFSKCNLIIEKTVRYNSVAPQYFLLQALKNIRPSLFTLQFVFLLK